MYSVVPQNQSPVSVPSLCFKSPQKTHSEKVKSNCREKFNDGSYVVFQAAQATYSTVVESVPNPLPECHRGKETVRLSKLIQLRVSIEHSCRDELVENTDDQRRKNGEDDVVE
jgi:hypothetical protein